MYPRYELVDEFRRTSDGQSFHIVSFSEFLTLFGASPQVVEEVHREETQAREIKENAPLIEESLSQSDVGVEFEVFYNIRPGEARLRIRDQTQAASYYGVLYQIGAEFPDGLIRLAPPLNFTEVQVTEVVGNILNGEKLIVRMVDEKHNHLAAARIDAGNWPPNVSGDRIQITTYWLYPPRERLRILAERS